jgi:hypothetical protein
MVALQLHVLTDVLVGELETVRLVEHTVEAEAGAWIGGVA